MSLSIIEKKNSYHCKYKIRKLIKTVMINIGTWYISKRHRYNDTLLKSSYPHYDKKVTEIVYHAQGKRGTWHKGIMGQRKLDDTMKHKNKNEKIIIIMKENKLKLQLWGEHRQCKILAKSHLSKDIREKGEFIVFYINKWVTLHN